MFFLFFKPKLLEDSRSLFESTEGDGRLGLMSFFIDTFMTHQFSMISSFCQCIRTHNIFDNPTNYIILIFYIIIIQKRFSSALECVKILLLIVSFASFNYQLAMLLRVFLDVSTFRI